MDPFARLPAVRLRDVLASVAVVVTMVMLVVWSMLLNATDIVAGLFDHTGTTPPTRRQ
jgi:hypothetical protein